MRTFSVKNFETFQHYKDRSPPWIKLYNELLDDYEFGLLPDATKMHLVAIWLLASRSENKIPFDPTWVARRINATDKVNLQLLADRGFILLDQELQTTEQSAIAPLATCLSREREEGETEKRERQNVSDDDFEKFWEAYPTRSGANPKAPAAKLFYAAVKAGSVPADIIRGARLCAVSESQKIGTEFIPQAVKWLRDRRWQDYLAADAPKPSAADVAAAMDWDKILTSYKQFGHWSRYAGPSPDSPACLCPQEMLAKYGFVGGSQQPDAPLLRGMQ